MAPRTLIGCWARRGRARGQHGGTGAAERRVRDRQRQETGGGEGGGTGVCQWVCFYPSPLFTPFSLRRSRRSSGTPLPTRWWRRKLTVSCWQGLAGCGGSTRLGSARPCSAPVHLCVRSARVPGGAGRDLGAEVPRSRPAGHSLLPLSRRDGCAGTPGRDIGASKPAPAGLAAVPPPGGSGLCCVPLEAGNHGRSFSPGAVAAGQRVLYLLNMGVLKEPSEG